MVTGGHHGYGGHGHHHGHRGFHHRGPAVIGGWGLGWGPSYGWADPYYDDYEPCYVRRVKYRGRWVYRRYCD
jgi:hypothetical protein